jgi:anti-sigma B factor antagonist
MHDQAVELTGEWTIHAISQRRDEVKALVDAGSASFDMSAVTDMDSAGLQLWVATRQSLALAGKELNLLNPSKAVKAILITYGLDVNLSDASQESIYEPA